MNVQVTLPRVMIQYDSEAIIAAEWLSELSNTKVKTWRLGAPKVLAIDAVEYSWILLYIGRRPGKREINSLLSQKAQITLKDLIPIKMGARY